MPPKRMPFMTNVLNVKPFFVAPKWLQILEQTFFTVKDILADNIRMRSERLFC